MACDFFLSESLGLSESSHLLLIEGIWEIRNQVIMTPLILHTSEFYFLHPVGSEFRDHRKGRDVEG